MIFSCPAKAFPKLISFTIQSPPGTTIYGSYQAEYGMTWEQWVSSTYNVDRYKIVDSLGLIFPEGELHYSTPPFVVTSDSRPGYGDVISHIAISDAIVDKMAYERMNYFD